jgi:hypothetical protein
MIQEEIFIISGGPKMLASGESRYEFDLHRSPNWLSAGGGDGGGLTEKGYRNQLAGILSNQV